MVGVPPVGVVVGVVVLVVEVVVAAVAVVVVVVGAVAPVVVVAPAGATVEVGVSLPSVAGAPVTWGGGTAAGGGPRSENVRGLHAAEAGPASGIRAAMIPAPRRSPTTLLPTNQGRLPGAGCRGQEPGGGRGAFV